MHADFVELLNQYGIAPELIPVVRAQLANVFKTLTYDTQNDNQQVRKRITELNTKLKSLHYKFLDGDIAKEDYHDLKNEILTDRKECEQMIHPEFKLSNPNLMTERAIEYLLKMGDTWSKSTNEGKNNIQKIVFPEGINYLKEKRQYRTSKVNSLMELISANKAFKRRNSGNQERLESAEYNDGSPPLNNIELLMADTLNFIKLIA